MSVKYIRLQSGDELPTVSDLQPFKAILVIEDDVSQIWQWDVSRWLVQSGCRYVMAWGRECSTWGDAIDEANLEAFDYDVIPEDRVVMTTSHEDEELSEVFWFSKHRASHPVHELRNTVILHISGEEKQSELETMHEQA
jgi:hypothetical protein